MRTRVRKLADWIDFVKVMRKEAQMHRDYRLRVKRSRNGTARLR